LSEIGVAHQNSLSSCSYFEDLNKDKEVNNFVVFY